MKNFAGLVGVFSCNFKPFHCHAHKKCLIKFPQTPSLDLYASDSIGLVLASQKTNAPIIFLYYHLMYHSKKNHCTVSTSLKT